VHVHRRQNKRKWVEIKEGRYLGLYHRNFFALDNKTLEGTCWIDTYKTLQKEFKKKGDESLQS
jgi:hypothetical protein